MHDVGGGALGLCKVSSRIFCIDLTIGGFRHSWRRLPIYINRVSNYTVYIRTKLYQSWLLFVRNRYKYWHDWSVVKGDKNRCSESQNSKFGRHYPRTKVSKNSNPARTRSKTQWASQIVRGEHVRVNPGVNITSERTPKQVLSFGTPLKTPHSVPNIIL